MAHVYLHQLVEIGVLSRQPQQHIVELGSLLVLPERFSVQTAKSITKKVINYAGNG